MKPPACVEHKLAAADAAIPEFTPRRVVLPTGTTVLLRPIRGEDKPLLIDLFRRQSPESRYLRFMGGIAELSESQLHDLTEVDHVDHEAWIALDLSAPGEPCVGVARYVRLAKESSEAEVAVAVVDSHQRLGIGTALLALISRSATEHGIRTFRACVFGSNLPVVRIFQGRGATVTRQEGDVLSFTVPVPAEDVSLELR